MINSLTGTVTGKLQGAVMLQCGSIEWFLLASDQTLSSLPGHGMECTVYTYLHHREDQLFMVGFADETERQLFLDLISVSGIGPKQGLKILSGLSVPLLTEAIRHDDLAVLSKVPGLGKKTAQKLILALKGKLIEPAQQDTADDLKDILDALVQMGYERQKARRVLKEAASSIDAGGMDTSQRESALLKQAIARLS